MKKQYESLSQGDDNDIPCNKFPGMIELMEIQEELHAKGKEQKKEQDMNQSVTTKFLLVVLILFFISNTTVFAQNSDCESFLKMEKDYSSLSFMDTWTKNSSPYGIQQISSKEILVSYGDKKDVLSFLIESEIKMIKAQGENLEIIILSKEPKILRTHHFVKGINLRNIIPYKDESCFRQKISKEEVLLSNPAGDSIVRYDTGKNIFKLFKKCNP